MSVELWLAVFSALLSFVGLIAVAIQMRAATTQRRLEAINQIYDINRQLLSLGFSHPKLFEILEDTKNADPAWERRYLQMWLNQFSLIHAHLKHGGFDAEFRDSLERDIADFVSKANMQRHWSNHGEFYPPSFQDLVNQILAKVDPPPELATGSRRKHVSGNSLKGFFRHFHKAFTAWGR